MACSHDTQDKATCPDHARRLQVKLMANEIRQDIIKLVSAGKSGHPGGSLSAADIMAVLFFDDVMDYNKDDATDKSQDRFFLSKGHAAPVLYATFHQLGWVKDSELGTLRQLGSRLQGHPDCHALPGVEVCSGSLGQGLSVASGCALGLQLDAQAAQTQPHKVFVLLGDGELQEGSNWEAAMFAAHRGLDNLIAIVDSNNLQIDGHVEDVCSLGDLPAKFQAFGWNALTVNGHCIRQLEQALAAAKAHKGAPSVIVCTTVKGKGVSFMEDQAGWHGKAPNEEQTAQALDELQAEHDKISQEVQNG